MVYVFDKMNQQQESDLILETFENYEKYLESLITAKDIYYLGSFSVARTVAELGFRTYGETLTKSDFYKRRSAVLKILHPKKKLFELASLNGGPYDEVQQELAIRERSNRLGIISTIVFVRLKTMKGFEVSSYIDYADRLQKEDWVEYFQGKKRLLPRPNDLAYYHWRNNTNTCNSSKNYKVIVDPVLGLLFQNRHDRNIINVDPSVNNPGNNTTRERIYCDKYEHVVIFDHLVRKKC